MEYSKDIILNIGYQKNRGQANKKEKKVKNLLKKHKVIATILIICGILMILDYILVYNFIEILQTLV